MSTPVVGLKNEILPSRENASVEPSGDHEGSEEFAKLVTTVPVAGSITSRTGVGPFTVVSSSTTAIHPPPGERAAAA